MEIWRRHIPAKRRLILNGLHSVISQNTEPSKFSKVQSPYEIVWEQKREKIAVMVMGKG
jgi:hypothetical protein